MSRGLGKLQRELLETLDQNDRRDRYAHPCSLAYQAKPGATAAATAIVSNAQHTAVRRALRICTCKDCGRTGTSTRLPLLPLGIAKVGLPKQLRWLQIGSGAKVRAEIAEILERMKQLGIAPTTYRGVHSLLTFPVTSSRPADHATVFMRPQPGRHGGLPPFDDLPEWAR